MFMKETIRTGEIGAGATFSFQERMKNTMSPHTNRRDFIQGSATLSLTALSPSAIALRALAEGLAGVSSSTPSPMATTGHPLMQPNLAHSLATRCLAKPVFERRILDDMETDKGWAPTSTVKLSYTEERSRTGKRSLRFSTLMRNEEFIRATRSPKGNFTGGEASFIGMPFSAFATLAFDTPQDWSSFNRISLWCYLHPTAIPITSLSLQFLCQDASAGPWDPVAIHYIGELKPGEWNHLTWEISEYPRNKVVEFILFKPTPGVPLGGLDPEITFDFDELALERIEVEPVSGWNVTSGKIAYSHFGYRPGAVKLAFCSEAEAATFDLIDAAAGTRIAQLPVKAVKNARAGYAVLEFTEVTRPGSYLLACGNSHSEEFRIGDDVWDLLIDATLNTLSGFRCGCSAPGAHDACHLDTFVEYQGERRSMAGGWHDAANNTQQADSSHLTVYTMLQLYERLNADPAQSERAARALDEALWGLDWSLRMRFAPGIRLLGSHVAYWTDSKVGTDDDVVQYGAAHDLRNNIYALVALSTAARVLRRTDSSLAQRILKVAEEDYADIRPNVDHPVKPVTYGDVGRGSWRDLAAYLTVSTIELFRVTGNPVYKNDAIRYGNWLVSLEEQSFIDGSPVTGYFYADAERTKIQREVYGGCDDSGLLALEALCESFPEESDWINWYAGLLIYSEYYCRQGSFASAPFDVIPTTVWRREDLETDIRPDRHGEGMATKPLPMFPTPPSAEVTRRQMRAMYEAGTELTPEMRLRIFPIWFNHVQHGSTTGHLCRTAGLGCAARIRGSLDLAELAARQIQWIVGANPFSRSLMFGVGYDYWQNFTCNNINFVGGLGLGMNSYGADAPAWPNNAVFPYKEQWSYSSNRMAINLAHSAVPARIRGRTAGMTTLREQRTDQIMQLGAGEFDRTLPPGRYVATCRGFEWNMDLVGGRTYFLALDPELAVTLTLDAGEVDGEVTVRAKLRGAGAHQIDLKLFNLTGANAGRKVILTPGKVTYLEWTLKVNDRSKSWVAVAIPESAPDLRKEVFGRVGAFAELS